MYKLGGARKEEIADRELKRIRGVQQFLDGKTIVQVAKDCNVTYGAAKKWINAYQQRGWDALRATKPSGHQQEFVEQHFKALSEIINKSPQHWGYETPLWTVKMARDVLKKEYNYNFSITTILRAMHTLGFHFKSRK